MADSDPGSPLQAVSVEISTDARGQDGEKTEDDYVENVFASLAADLDADSSPRAAEGEGEADEQVLEDKEKAAGAASNKQQHHQHNQQQQQQQQQQRDNSSLLGGGGGMLSAAAWCWKDPQSRSKTDIMTAVKQLRHWEVLRHAKAATLNVIAKTAIAKKLNEGDIICRQNTHDKNMYMCMSGELSIIYDPNKSRVTPPDAKHSPGTSAGTPSMQSPSHMMSPMSPISALTAGVVNPHSPLGSDAGTPASGISESVLAKLQHQESMRLRWQKEAEAEKRNIPIGFRGLDDILVAVFKEVELPPVEGPEFLGQVVSKVGVGKLVGHVSALAKKPMMFSSRAAVNSNVLVLDARLCRQICSKEQIDRADAAALLHGIECFTRFPENVLVKMVGVLTVERFPMKSLVLMQNRTASKLCIVRSGNLEVLRMIRNPHEFEDASKVVTKPSDVKEREKAWVNVSIADLTHGDLFGHQEVLTGRKALFTVRAKSDVEVWTMTLEGIRSLGKEGGVLSSRLLEHARGLLSFHKWRFHEVGTVLFDRRAANVSIEDGAKKSKGAGPNQSSASLHHAAENNAALFGASSMTPDMTYASIGAAQKARKQNRTLSRLCPKVPQTSSALNAASCIEERGYVPAKVPRSTSSLGASVLDGWTPSKLDKEKNKGKLRWAGEKSGVLTRPTWFESLSYDKPVLQDPNRLNEREIKVHQRVFGVLHDYPVFARGVGKDAAIQDLGASSTAPQQTSKNPHGRRRSSVSIRALTLSLNEYIALLSHHLITMKTHNYKFDASYHVPEDKAVSFFFKAMKRRFKETGDKTDRDLNYDGLKMCLRCCCSYLMVRQPEEIEDRSVKVTRTLSSPVASQVEESNHEGRGGDAVHVNVSATSKDVASLAQPPSRVEVHLKRAELGPQSGNSVLSKSLVPNVLLSRGAIKVPSPDKSASKKKRYPRSMSPSKLPEINQSPQKYKSGIMPQHLLALLPHGVVIPSQDRGNENALASGESRSSTALSGVRHRHGGSGKWQSPFEARKQEDAADRQRSEVGHDSLAEALRDLKDQPVSPEASFKSRRAAAATPPSRGSSYVGGDDDYMDHHSESLRSRGGTPYEFVHLEDSQRHLVKSGGSNLTGGASDHTGPLEEEVIKFEQGRNLPREFVQEERGVHKSFYKAEQQGSSSKQGSSAGMSRAGSPPANENTTHRPPKMGSSALAKSHGGSSRFQKSSAQTSPAGSFKKTFQMPSPAGSKVLALPTVGNATVGGWNENDNNISKKAPGNDVAKREATRSRSNAHADWAYVQRRPEESQDGGGRGRKSEAEEERGQRDGEEEEGRAEEGEEEDKIGMGQDEEEEEENEIQRPNTASEIGQQNTDEMDAEIDAMTAEIEAQIDVIDVSVDDVAALGNTGDGAGNLSEDVNNSGQEPGPDGDQAASKLQNLEEMGFSYKPFTP